MEILVIKETEGEAEWKKKELMWKIESRREKEGGTEIEVETKKQKVRENRADNGEDLDQRELERGKQTEEQNEREGVSERNRGVGEETNEKTEVDGLLGSVKTHHVLRNSRILVPGGSQEVKKKKKKKKKKVKKAKKADVSAKNSTTAVHVAGVD